MKNDFVQLSNTAAFLDGFEKVIRRGAAENCFMVVDGKPGYGKTTTAAWFATQNQLPLVRAKAGWRPIWMMQELLETVQVTPEASYKKIFRQIIDEMSKRNAVAMMEERPFGIIIDEADLIIGSRSLIEELRSVSDLIEVPIVLIGMGKIQDGMKRFPQVSSRTEATVEFHALTIDDTKRLVDARGEVSLAPDLLQLLHTQAGGYAREVLSGLASIERVGRRLDRPITVADMLGHELLKVRATGATYVVRG